MGLTVALRDFFGLKPGQTLGEFAAEIRQLTADDKAFFKTHLEAAGYVII